MTTSPEDTALLPEGVSDDAFLGGQLSILQPREGYRAGLDAVLVAAALDEKGAAHVLDAGAGVGVVGLCVARRLAQARVVLVERDGALVQLARANVARNGLEARIKVMEWDLGAPLSGAPELAALAGTFDHVLANPPYHDAARGTSAPARLKADAHAMASGDLARWLRFLAAMAKPGGRAILIHRAEALGEVLAACEGRFGALRVHPLYPRTGAPASRILIEGIKGSRAPLSLAPGIVLHEANGRFRPAIEAVLREGHRLELC